MTIRSADLATPGHVEAADLVKSWNGTALHQSGTLFNGYPVDLLAIHNAYNSGTDSEYQAGVFNVYPEMLRRSVLWPTRGNHDAVYAGDNNDRLPDPASASAPL